ncbi:hypothetical protein I6F07_17325 [Ensifer sp. IC4062]|nr:hypothetical protein [Ensifer sp. IC4062]
MNILGLMVFGANPAACLLQDGQLVAFAEEERFIRKKYATNEFPTNSIKYCLELAKLDISDVAEISVGRAPNEYLWSVPRTYLASWLKYPKNMKTARWELRQLSQLNPLAAGRYIKNNLELAFPSSKLPPVSYVGHHESHAASAALMAGFNSCAVLTIDGHGEDDCSVIWHYQNGELKRVESHKFPLSLGWFYSAFTELFGFHKNSDEGRLMGLAAYGRPNNHWAEKVGRILWPTSDGYDLDPTFIWYGKLDAKLGISSRLLNTFGAPRAGPKEKFTQDDCDLAFAVQERFEECVLSLAQRASRLTGEQNIALAGGCALNCKTNGELVKQLTTHRVWPQPISSDAGCALGAALVAAQKRGERSSQPLKHLYWGPHFSQAEVRSALEKAGVHASQVHDPAKSAADLIAKGKIVGWMQGRMEAGPRALGGRSILANPQDPQMKDRVNRVKSRELWRPFCPSMLSGSFGRYLEGPALADPFMIVAQAANHTMAEELPSVVHVDGSARVQAVDAITNEPYARLLRETEDRTGHPVVLNTSLNRRGEPLVCSPTDAINMFANSSLDAMIIEDQLITRQ